MWRDVSFDQSRLYLKINIEPFCVLVSIYFIIRYLKPFWSSGKCNFKLGLCNQVKKLVIMGFNITNINLGIFSKKPVYYFPCIMRRPL